MSASGEDPNAFAQGRIGTILKGKYRIDAVLGVGGMAVVYAATHRNRKRFAVKMLHPELSIREDIRTRFLREGYVANSVEHPGAVVVLDDDTAEDGAAFIVMELLEGDGVDHLWTKGGQRLPIRAALSVAHQLLDVLAAAHARSIVHRDLKPANLFLSRDGMLKVLDFGIARLRDAAAGPGQTTSTGMLLGTPAFMSPEQALAKTSEIDAQSDLWAVGATLFVLLSGQLVHEGENASQLLVKAATTPPRSLAAVAPHVPAAIVEIVDRSLAFAKTDRWSTASAMRDAIRDAYLASFGEPLSRDPAAALFPIVDPALAPTSFPDLVVPDPVAPAVAPGTPWGSTYTPAPAPVADAPAPHPALVGGTTSQPIARDAGLLAAPRPDGRRSSRAVQVGALLVVLAVGIGVSRLSPRARTEIPTAAAASPSSAPTPVTPAPAQPALDRVATSVTSASAPAPAATPSPPTLLSGTPTKTPSTSLPSRRVSASAQAASSSRPAAASAAPLSAPSPPTCHAVPYFDSEGEQRFKQECR